MDMCHLLPYRAARYASKFSYDALQDMSRELLALEKDEREEVASREYLFVEHSRHDRVNDVQQVEPLRTLPRTPDPISSKIGFLCWAAT